MLDIRQIRDEPERCQERLKARGGDAWKLITEVIECDEQRRSGETEKQVLQQERNQLSKEIGKLR